MRLVLAALLACACVSQNPTAPIYPPVFSVQFFETQTTAAGYGETYGQSFYDSVNGLYRQDRFNGDTDIMCLQGIQMNGTTPCTHLVVQNNRYLVYPDQSNCCYCCNSTDGCGVLNNTWLTGAQYLGIQEFADLQVYAWNQSGNYYYETIATDATQRIPVGLERDNPGLLDIFEYLEYVPEVPSNAFDLPSQCFSPPLCGGLCAYFRANPDLKTS